MGYSIIYDKQFVKVGEKYLPLVLGGDNNLYDVGWNGRERRSRSWYPAMHEHGHQYLYTEEEMLAYVQQYRQERMERSSDYTDKSFGWDTGIAIGGNSCSNTTFGMYKGIFTSGMKYALPVEQLGCSIHFRTMYTDVKFDAYASTTEQLEKVIEDALRFEAENGKPVYVTMHLGEKEVSNLRINHFGTARKRSAKFIKADEPHYSLHVVGYGSFVKLTSRSLKYQQWGNGKRFATRKDVDRQIERIKSKYGNDYFSFEVKEHNIEKLQTA